MDDFLMIRFALDNVHPADLGEGARKAFDRVLSGEAIADPDSGDGRQYERLRGMARRSNEKMGAMSTHLARTQSAA